VQYASTSIQLRQNAFKTTLHAVITRLNTSWGCCSGWNTNTQDSVTTYSIWASWHYL